MADTTGNAGAVEKADNLLHDAQGRYAGAGFAEMLGQKADAKKMREDVARMIREAYALDAEYCEECRKEDQETGGTYASFWQFAEAVTA